MKKFLLCFALCAFAFAFSSCEEAPVENPGNEQTPSDENENENENENGGNTQQPTIEFQIISENPMEFTAEGGACVIKYAITNPDEALTVTATTEAAWISEDDSEVAGEENTLYFIVAKNEVEESRTATIVVTYDREYEVVINQAAAEPTEDPKPEIDYSIVIKSANPMEFSAEGGPCKIYYEIVNPKVGVYFIESYSTEDWIENDYYAGEGDFSYTVKPNTATEPRTGKVILTYGEVTAEVVINQAAHAGSEPDPIPDPSEAVNLPYMSGNYFGSMYGATENDYNYCVVLSTMENCVDIVTGENHVYAGNIYLYLDLYSSTPAENYNASFRVPDGLYLFDSEDSGEAGTIGAKYSFLYDATGAGVETFFSDGSVTVEDGTIYCTLKGEDGQLYVFSSNDIEVDNTKLFKGNGYVASTLTGDLHIPFENPSLRGECSLDYYVLGRNYWTIYVRDNSDEYHSLQLDLFLPYNELVPQGEFVVSEDITLDKIILPGFLNSYNDNMWSWYYTDEAYATIREGKVTFTKNSNGTVTAVLDLKDDQGNKITGECTATYTHNVYQQSAASCVVRTEAKPSRK